MKRRYSSVVCFFIVGFAFINSQPIENELSTTLLRPAGSIDLQGDSYGTNIDAQLTTPQLIRKYGYIGESHQVQTTDGYILEVHRITGSRSNPKPDGKPVVFIMHGLLASSADWVIPGPEKGLAYILADEGYDVWLGNARGNVYSRKHVSKTISKKDYWSFSWHEIGTRDLPAMIDYVIATTGREKIFYMGHSQGTTAFFVMSTELPAYQDKVVAMFAMAPIAYVSRMFSPVFQFLARFTSHIAGLMELIGQYEFEPTDGCLRKFTSLVCDKSAITQPLCSNVLFLIAGFNNDQLNKTLLPSILGHVPAGASVKQFQHYAQLIKSGKFRQYDHGIWANMKIYKTFTPPAYDLTKIRVPVALHYSSNDWLANVKDVNKLYDALQNPIGKFRVPHDKFNHLDFMWGIDAKQLLFDKMISLMTRFK